MTTEALSAIEFNSIAIGIKALDEMVKIAPIHILRSVTMSPGKFIIVFCGDVASVEYSFKKGLEIGDVHVIDTLYLPYVHADVVAAMTTTIEPDMWNALGILETYTIVSCIEAADIAVKTSAVKLIEIRLSNGYGGKSYVKMLGDLDQVTTGMQACIDFVTDKKVYCIHSIIAQPHEEIKDVVLNKK